MILFSLKTWFSILIYIFLESTYVFSYNEFDVYMAKASYRIEKPLLKLFLFFSISFVNLAFDNATIFWAVLF